MKKHFPVIIVGGGQAGLSISYCLRQKEIEHIIFDKGEVGDSWKLKRWDNFTLVTPNWQCELPGYKYNGDNPNGFMGREEVVQFVKDYAKSFDPPLQSNTEVYNVGKHELWFEVETSIGDFTADQVVVATSAFHNPMIPPVAEKLPESVMNIHSSEYRNAAQMPEGATMVVGSGQSGCQIAEDLHLEGKKVHLCVGNAPKSPRSYRGRDVVNWLADMKYYDKPIDSFPDPVAVRKKVNHYLTGRDGGREIDLRVFALEGMGLYGIFKDVKDGKIHFGDGLAEDLDKADAAAQSIKDRIDQYIADNNIEVPVESDYIAPWHPKEVVSSIDPIKENITSVIWCVGFGTDFSWIDIPVFDAFGYPSQRIGVTDVSGLFFLGLPWMHTWGSGRFSGIAKDAWYLTDKIVENMSITA